MDVEIKSDKETQTSLVPLSDVDVQCTPLKTNVVSLPFHLPSTSHQYCAICKGPFGRKSYLTLPEDIRLQILISESIYLRPVIRCCKSHILNNTLKPDAIEKVRSQYPPISSISGSDVM
jgi:hypothetical protein